MVDAAPDLLKLIALDEEDLTILSAHLQDAVMRVDGLKYITQDNRFILALNRFVWSKSGQVANERRRAALHFERVTKVQKQNIRQQAPDAILNLLAIQFLPTDTPVGTIDLIFSDNGVIRLEVDCIEAQLSDLGGAWETTSRPQHDFETENGDAS